jgi:hypothetical protein
MAASPLCFEGGSVILRRQPAQQQEDRARMDRRSKPEPPRHRRIERVGRVRPWDGDTGGTGRGGMASHRVERVRDGQPMMKSNLAGCSIALSPGLARSLRRLAA